MRGREKWHISEKNRLGITPAYAGKSAFCVAIMDSAVDHPRVCGEELTA